VIRLGLPEDFAAYRLTEMLSEFARSRPGLCLYVRCGLGVSILPEVAILPEHTVLDTGDGFPPITDTEVALVAAPETSAATRHLAEALAHFCSALDLRMAA
jgi:DNA-binding transcriptional LysR family regulator